MLTSHRVKYERVTPSSRRDIVLNVYMVDFDFLGSILQPFVPSPARAGGGGRTFFKKMV